MSFLECGGQYLLKTDKVKMLATVKRVCLQKCWMWGGRNINNLKTVKISNPLHFGRNRLLLPKIHFLKKGQKIRA